MTLGIYVTWIGRFFLLIMIEKETGTLEDSRFKFTTEPRHFTFMGRPHVAHYPKCTAKIYKIFRTPIS